MLLIEVIISSAGPMMLTLAEHRESKRLLNFSYCQADLNLNLKIR